MQKVFDGSKSKLAAISCWLAETLHLTSFLFLVLFYSHLTTAAIWSSRWMKLFHTYSCILSAVKCIKDWRHEVSSPSAVKGSKTKWKPFPCRPW